MNIAVLVPQMLMRLCFILLIVLGVGVSLWIGRASLTNVTASAGMVVESNDAQNTPAETQEAIKGYHRVFTDHNFTLLTEVTPSKEMPSWDPVAHFVGERRLPNGKVAYVLWLSDQYRGAMDDLKATDPAIAKQIVGATLMVAMDSGLAGPKWRSRFRGAARKDEALPPNVADRFLNRHALVAPLAQDRSIYGAAQPPKGIVGLTGNNLTAPIRYARGLLGYSQAGIGAARITELMDDPRALAEPMAQRFIDDWFSHVGAMLPTERAKAYLRQQRNLLVVDASFDPKRNGQAFGQAMQSVASEFTPKQTAAFVLGVDAEQSYYNAALSHRTDIDSMFRKSIAQNDALDAALPKLAAMRQRLGALSSSSWMAIANESAAMVGYILSMQ